MRKRKPYSPAYLKAIDSDYWRALRRQVSTRADHCCEHCQTKHGLTLHHKHYNTLGRELPMDVELLCEPCHEKADRQRVAVWHSRRKAKKKRRKKKRWQKWEEEATRPADIGEYLETNWWKAKQAELLKAAGYQCTCCGSTEGVEVRHRTYHRLYAEGSDDLLVLCLACHEFVQGA